MGKKRSSWLSCVKRLFIPQSKAKSEEKPEKWRRFLEVFSCRQYPMLEAPQKGLNEATEEQRKHALAVAIATAAAAEAAVAAANAAAEVVRLTNNPHELERRKQYFAAIRIQSAYRGHLARKALSALKGIVKLQAVVRGELTRRSVVKTLSSMFLLTKAQPQLRQSDVRPLLDYLNHGEKRHSLSQKEGVKSEERKLQCNGHRSWDLSLVSKEGMESLYLQRQEAIAKRERMKQYSFSHRERIYDQKLQEITIHKENRKINRFDQFVEVYQHEDKEKLKPSSHNSTIAVDASGLAQLKLRAICRQEMVEESNSPFTLPRRSFCHVKQKSIREDGSLPSSPVFPTYMAATESAKAKSRSLSTPRQRLRLCETYSGELSPVGLSSWSSFNSEITKSNKRNSISQHTSSTLGTPN
ncbi:protein IQ-DOMAIN 14 [Sesamum indicum]|uniref:protein IQ-DOMAIN 14 n=1 Tax=Sesamum indicum TaxID=4182 RepID=A0A6I9SXC8_SESIN|nr:protein IQ-DOMAIN 14 [Sesamum indicum]XP_011075369.1 protein IQ-DOMAIN 14 [Sesamum indicum]XP_011075370.1 protein IQ-DOMAIN 14 [Sesamum indicum]